MITYRQLGKVGRLGNALFELAATVGIAMDRGEDIIFPQDWMHRPYFSVPDELFGDVPPSAKDATDFADHLDYRARPYLQDVNLFLPYLDLIRSWLQPSEHAIEILSYYELPKRPRLGIHVRRGDNVFDPGVPNKGDYHFCPPWSYYYEAAAEFADDYVSTSVFSDDIEACKLHLPAQFYGDGRPYWKEHEDRFGQDLAWDWIDLFLMSRCDYLVITGSTYGIWGAFLANLPPQNVIRCDKVYGPIVSAYTNSELMFDPNWRVINVDESR